MMAIYYPPAVFANGDLCKPHIFEIHQSGTVAASSEQVGFPATAPSNELTYERWKPSALPAAWQIDFGAAKTINYCAIAAHLLYYKVINVQSSTDAVNWVTRHSITPTDNAPIIVMFPSASAQYWRLSITAGTNAAYGSSIPTVGVIYFGDYLRFPWALEVGISPLFMSRNTVYATNASEGGNWLGRSVRRTSKSGSYTFKGMGRDWYKNNVDTMIRRARAKPFFFASSPLAMPWDVAYCWLTKDPVPATQAGMLMEVTLTMEAHGHD